MLTRKYFKAKHLKRKSRMLAFQIEDDKEHILDKKSNKKI